MSKKNFASKVRKKSGGGVLVQRYMIFTFVALTMTNCSEQTRKKRKLSPSIDLMNQRPVAMSKPPEVGPKVILCFMLRVICLMIRCLKDAALDDSNDNEPRLVRTRTKRKRFLSQSDDDVCFLLTIMLPLIMYYMDSGYTSNGQGG
jgi:hypothetical protein